MGGGIMEAAMGDGERQRGSSWLALERRSRRLEEAREESQDALRRRSDMLKYWEEVYSRTWNPFWM